MFFVKFFCSKSHGESAGGVRGIGPITHPITKMIRINRKRLGFGLWAIASIRQLGLPTFFMV
jgi:hypothetical protein